MSNIFTNLHHNFWTRNPSRSSKVSKDSDCSLVSSKNFSEILQPNGWRLKPGKVGQGSLKVLYLWRHSQKPASPKQKIFFRVQTRRLATSFETFTGSVEHTRPEKFRAKPRAFKRFFSENPRILADAKELIGNITVLHVSVNSKELLTETKMICPQNLILES